MMKKVFIILLIALVVSVTIGSCAAADPGYHEVIESDFKDGEGNVISTGSVDKQTTVILELAQSFEVTIPEQIIFKDNGEGEYAGLGVVSATVHLLNPDHRLTVSVASDSYDDVNACWVLKETNSGSNKVNYLMKNGATDEDHLNIQAPSNLVTPNVPIITINGVTSDTSYLHLKIKDKMETVVTGSYEDLLTFTVNVVDLTP